MMAAGTDYPDAHYARLVREAAAWAVRQPPGEMVALPRGFKVHRIDPDKEREALAIQLRSAEWGVVIECDVGDQGFWARHEDALAVMCEAAYWGAAMLAVWAFFRVWS